MRQKRLWAPWNMHTWRFPSSPCEHEITFACPVFPTISSLPKWPCDDTDKNAGWLSLVQNAGIPKRLRFQFFIYIHEASQGWAPSLIMNFLYVSFLPYCIAFRWFCIKLSVCLHFDCHLSREARYEISHGLHYSSAHKVRVWDIRKKDA